MAEESYELLTIFEDDSHTFADGPLQRFFRMRKWFFACSVMLLLLGTNWLDWVSIKELIHAPRLPLSVLQSAMTLTGCYLLVQAVLVLTQLGAVYGITLQLRVALLMDEKARGLRRRTIEARAGLDEIEEKLLRSDLSTAQRERWELQRNEQRALSDNLHLRLGAESSRAKRKRHFTWLTEVALDTMRIVPSVAFLTYAVFWHGRLPMPKFHWLPF